MSRLALSSFAVVVGLVACGSRAGDHVDGHPTVLGNAGASGGATGETDPGPGGILVAASGEVLALGGYPFPPANPNDAAFVDGWEMHFDRVLVTIAHVVVADNPDLSPTDQAQTGGVIARRDGPWAIDLHAGGPLQGQGGAGEQAIAFTSFPSRDDGAPFDPTLRYAFGFDVVAAAPNAARVNLDAAALADYGEMIARGYSVLYVGTATFRGSACTAGGSSYDFARLPPVVAFRFGFASPTSYVNCQNPNDTGKPFEGEEHERGIQVLANRSVIAQVTIHTDHPFWESVVHDSPRHFDPIAARYVGRDGGVPTATLDDQIGVDFTAFHDATGAPLPWRTCLASYRPPNGTMAFDARNVPIDPGASPDQALRDYRDFMTYDQSTQGHLNADGLCFVRRNYPSPR